MSLQCEQCTVQADLKGLFLETVFLQLLSTSPASLRSSGLWGWDNTCGFDILWYLQDDGLTPEVCRDDQPLLVF